MITKTRPPRHLSDESRAWFASVTKDFDLENHHLLLLRAACESWDRAQLAREALAKVGMTFVDRHGHVRPHPATVIARDSMVLFARLVRELGLDVVEPTGHTSANDSRHRPDDEVVAMPRITRRVKRRSEGYSEAHIRQLQTGSDIFGDAFGSGADLDEAAAKAAWDILGERLTTDWIAAQPLSRPWGWWRWQAPGRRERIDGGVHPHDNKERSRHVAGTDNPRLWKAAYGLHFGLPTAYHFPFDLALYHDFMRNALSGNESAVWESEATYLRRHGLLTSEENALEETNNAKT